MGGPCLISQGNKFILGARNIYNNTYYTRIFQINPTNFAIEKEFNLETAGDASYTGLQFFNDSLRVLYYTTPSGSANAIIAAAVIPGALFDNLNTTL